MAANVVESNITNKLGARTHYSRMPAIEPDSAISDDSETTGHSDRAKCGADISGVKATGATALPTATSPAHLEANSDS